MAATEFQIVVSDLTCSAEEWRRALNADDSELPELTREQKEWAKRFGVDEKEYARGLLAGLYGNQRQRKRAQELGQEISKVLDVVGPNYKLAAVLWQGSKLRWLARVQTPERIVGIPILFELADDVIDSGILSEIEKLRATVLAGVGRDDLIPKRI